MNKLYRLVRYDWPIHFTLVLTNWLPDNVIIMRLRGFLIRPYFKKCGTNLRVARGNIFCDSYNIEIGKDVYIGYGNWFSGSTLISIDDQVMFGPKSLVISGNHKRIKGSFRYGEDSFAAIRIGYGSWIGGNCAILAGTTIGKGSVIGANSVVNGVIPDDVVAAGNPAVIKKQLHD